MRVHSATTLVAALCLLPVIGVAQGRTQGAPARDWPRATPAALGLNPAVLDSIDREIRAGAYGAVDRLLVIRHGKVAFDQRYVQNYDSIYRDSLRNKSALNSHDFTGPYNYFNPWWHPYYRRGSLHSLQSVTKTIASVIIGVAITRGDFPSIDTPILTFFDTTAVRNIDDRKRRITVRHLLTMTGGIDWNQDLPFSDPNNAETALEASPDWVQFTIDRPMMREPGTVFNYSSGESVLLAHIFSKATGLDLEEYAARHLFGPIGIQQWYWKRTPAGTIDSEGGLYLDAADVARIWYLFTQRGLWNGTRIVSDAWITQSTTPAVPVEPPATNPMYGFKWWLYRDALDPSKYIWSGSGFGGQFPMAFPDQDMIVVVNAWNILPVGKRLPRGKLQERLQKAVVRR